MRKCEPFRLKPVASNRKYNNPNVRLREGDYAILADLRDLCGMPMCEIIHQCLKYCMAHTDLDDQEQYPGLLGAQIQNELLQEAD